MSYNIEKIGGTHDMKKKVILISVVVVIILIVLNGSKKECAFNQMVVSGANGILTVYQNGEDITDWYLEANEKAVKAIQEKFCNADDIEIIDICHLQDKAITVAAVIDDQNYSFLCNFDGDIISYSRPEALINPEQVFEEFVDRIKEAD